MSTPASASGPAPRGDPPRVLAICLNPAIDRVIVAPGAARGGTVRAPEVLETAGGKATHAAVVASNYGADVRLVGPVGGGRGRSFTELLNRSRIRLASVPVAPEIRETWTVVDPDVGDVLEVIGPSPSLAPEEVERVLTTTQQLLGWATDVLLAGSAAGGIDAVAYAEIVSEAQARGTRVLLDASGEALRAGLRAGPHVACPNLAEACVALGRPAPEELSLGTVLEVACGVRALGARAVALTVGAWGALVLSPEGRAWHAVPPARPRVNAVGCGDAFLGALAVALAQGRGFAEAARIATAAALDKLGRLHPGEVDPRAARALEPEVVVRRVG